MTRELACADSSVRILRLEDMAPMRTLFESVFSQPLSAEMMEYKYGGGRGLSLGLFEGDALVAHCGIFPRDFLLFGNFRRIPQFGDLMVAPAARGSLRRKLSPFFRIITAAQLCLGGKDNSERLFFGFPSGRAMAVGERLGLFAEVTAIKALEWPAASVPRVSLVAPLPSQEALREPRLRDAADTLWEAMAEDLADMVVGVRDAKYLHQRFMTHPRIAYHAFMLQSRWRKRPLGIFILRPQGDCWELVDWVAPREVMPAVIEKARQIVGVSGGKRMTTWISDSHAELLATPDCRELATEFRIPVRGDSSPTEIALLKKRWWLTAGDTDYR